MFSYFSIPNLKSLLFSLCPSHPSPFQPDPVRLSHTCRVPLVWTSPEGIQSQWTFTETSIILYYIILYIKCEINTNILFWTKYILLFINQMDQNCIPQKAGPADLSQIVQWVIVTQKSHYQHKSVPPHMKYLWRCMKTYGSIAGIVFPNSKPNTLNLLLFNVKFNCLHLLRTGVKKGKGF